MTTRTEMQIEIAEAFMSLLKTSLAIDHLADVGDDVSMERMIDVYTEQEMAAFALAAKYGWDWEQDDDWVPEHMTGTEIAHYGLSRAMEKCKVPCCDRERNPDPAGSKDMDPNKNPTNASTRMTFAGVTFKTTKHSKVRKPALIKILRSGKVNVFCRGTYTDDYAWDAAVNYGRGELPPEGITGLADDIERDSSGWWCSAYQEENGTLRLGCHSFKSYTLKEA